MVQSSIPAFPLIVAWFLPTKRSVFYEKKALSAFSDLIEFGDLSLWLECRKADQFATRFVFVLQNTVWTRGALRGRKGVKKCEKASPCYFFLLHPFWWSSCSTLTIKNLKKFQLHCYALPASQRISTTSPYTFTMNTKLNVLCKARQKNLQTSKGTIIQQRNVRTPVKRTRERQKELKLKDLRNWSIMI